MLMPDIAYNELNKNEGSCPQVKPWPLRQCLIVTFLFEKQEKHQAVIALKAGSGTFGVKLFKHPIELGGSI